MDRRGIEIKVGVFVLVAIAIAAVMIVRFGKGSRAAEGGFTITAKFTEVGGIIRGAAVYYQGVYVGIVSNIGLDEASNEVAITLAIAKSVRIPTNARFEIRQVGFLGDKVINIMPVVPSSGKYLQPGAVVEGLVPADIANLAEQAGGMIHQIGGFVANLDTVIKRVNTEMLDPATMANTRATIANAATATAETTATLREIRELLKANRAAVDTALSNFANITAEIDQTAKKVDSVVTDNAPKVNASVTNFQDATASMKSLAVKLQDTATQLDALMAKMEKGEGALGVLLADPKAKEELKESLENLSAFSANVRKHGILWYKDEAPPKSPEEPRKEGKPQGPGNRGYLKQKPATAPSTPPASPQSEPRTPQPATEGETP